ncbi:MAG: LuxR family transcriptional regulator [Nocardia sp.]|nr:LuxR family transcriptional regulator [Nocardia sp.]
MSDSLLVPVRPAPVQTVLRAPELSGREVEVLRAWILAETKEQVCGQLFIAPGTVKTHISRIRDKYSQAGRPAPTKASLLARALQDGYLRLDQI